MPRHPLHSIALAALALALLAAAAAAQTLGRPGGPPCNDPEHRQFDFWIGEWDVYTADGQLAGTNRVERLLGGCALQEHWKGSRGLAGTSLNAYSPSDQKWHQTWVDGNGMRLDLTGSLVDGRMVLEGDAAGAGRMMKNRITWEKLEDGRVRQHWQVSADGGIQWTDAFVGFYVRQKPAAPAAAKKGKR
jgi:hypothetical protein